MTRKLSYKQMRDKLDLVLRKLEDTDASDIDKIIILHEEALTLIDSLEDQLTKISKTVKKTK